jgi:PRC-barrel domain
MKSLMIAIALVSATALCAGGVSAEQSPPPSPDQSTTPATTGPSTEPGAAAPSTPPPAVRPSASPVATAPPSTDLSARPLVDAGSVIGTVVRNPEGKDIGKVSALLLDPHDGRVASAVITVGGVLGMGGSTVSVPWTALRLGQDNHKLVVTMDQNTLEQAPSATPRTAPDPQKK